MTKVGQRFGKLVVVEVRGYTRGNQHLLCRCDCGNEKVVRAGNLSRGATSSCGCSRQRVELSRWQHTGRLPKNNRDRRQILISERGNECEVCGYSCTPALQVHHIVRVADGGADDRANLLLLCANCHAIVETLASKHGYTFTDNDLMMFDDDQVWALREIADAPD